MITPTVGRVVWFYKAGKPHTEQPYAAIVTYVHSDTMINVVAFDYNGVPFGETSVLLIQDEGCYGNPMGGSWACWMPYQIGQAAKNESAKREKEDFPDVQPLGLAAQGLPVKKQ